MKKRIPEDELYLTLGQVKEKPITVPLGEVRKLSKEWNGSKEELETLVLARRLLSIVYGLYSESDSTYVRMKIKQAIELLFKAI